MKIIPAKNFALFICIACFSSGWAQTTIVLQPDSSWGKDALLHGLLSESNTNFGANTEFPAVAWSYSSVDGTIRSIMDFNLTMIPANAIINAATLSLYAIDNQNGQGQHSAQSGSNACWLERVTSSWDEFSVTWNNQPSTTIQNRVALPQSTSPAQNYLNMDVTALVSDMVNDPANSFGFMLKLQNEIKYRRMNFCSTDHPDPSLHPELIITYSLPLPSDTCLVLQPDFTVGKDAVLHGLSSEQNVNYGANEQFVATAWTFSGNLGIVRSILQFDLSSVPSNAMVNAAYLSLYAWDSGTGLGQHSDSNSCWLERITSTWNETDVTWNNQPSTDIQNRVALAESTSETQNYLNINVTLLVKDMLNTNNFGCMLKLQDETKYKRMNFCSSDHANSSLRPKLEICYSYPVSSKNFHENNSAMLLYPNPNDGNFNLQIRKSENVRLEIYNLLGEMVYSKQLERSENPAQAGRATNNEQLTTDLSHGIYFLKIYDGENIETHKISVVK